MADTKPSDGPNRDSIERLFDMLDSDRAFSDLGESEKDEIMESGAADLANEYSFTSKLGRRELERNLRDGLDACDPAGFSSGIRFNAVTLGKAEYDAISSALREEFRSIDADNMDPEDELFKRAAARIAGVAYTKDADAFEAALIADDRKLPAFGDAYANAEAVYYDKVGGLGGLDGLADMVVPEAKPKPEKGLWNWAKRHWKGLGIIGLLGTAGAYGAYNMWKDNAANQQRVDQLKSHGGTDDTAKSFNAKWGPKLAGPGNVFNSSVLSLYDVHVDNATLAQIIESGARTADGSVWGTVKYVADNLQTPQYMPKTAVEAKCMSKLIGGVSNITAYPKEPKAYSADAKTLLYDIGIGVGNEAAAWGGVRSVANYMLGLIRNGTITTNGLDGEDLQRLVMPIQLASMDIKTGQPSFTGYQLAIFEKNTTPDASLGGLTPLQWLGKTLNYIKSEKGPRYDIAIWFANRTLAVVWKDAVNAYHEEIKNLPEKNDILFVYEAGGLRAFYRNANGTVAGPIVNVSGADVPFYDSIVGMFFGMPVKARSANYPMLNNVGQIMTHDDPCVWSPTLHRYVGPFMHPDEMANVYTDPNIKMDLKESDRR